MKSTSTAVLAILFIVAVIIVMPFATIWSLNTLFPVLAIPYTWETWLATNLLQAAVAGGSLRVNRK